MGDRISETPLGYARKKLQERFPTSQELLLRFRSVKSGDSNIINPTELHYVLRVLRTDTVKQSILTCNLSHINRCII